MDITSVTNALTYFPSSDSVVSGLSWTMTKVACISGFRGAYD